MLKTICLVTLFLLSACVPAALHAERPPDFELRYDWGTGSLPPPYNYHYTITIGPGTSGTIVFKADANAEDPVNWTESFPLSASEMDVLYAHLIEIGAFSKTWQQVEDLPDGGSVDELSITAYRKVYNIPAYIDGAEQARDKKAVEDEITSLVPPTIWEEWNARHVRYIAENGG